MTTASCMGGWCQYRNACDLHTKADRRTPVERLCEFGKESPVNAAAQAPALARAGIDHGSLSTPVAAAPEYALIREDGWVEYKRC
jgi:hypothetical protein